MIRGIKIAVAGCFTISLIPLGYIVLHNPTASTMKFALVMMLVFALCSITFVHFMTRFVYEQHKAATNDMAACAENVLLGWMESHKSTICGD